MGDWNGKFENIQEECEFSQKATEEERSEKEESKQQKHSDSWQLHLASAGMVWCCSTSPWVGLKSFAF